MGTYLQRENRLRPITDSEKIRQENRQWIILALILFFIIGFAVIATAQEVQINNNLIVEADGTLRMQDSATVWNDIMVFPDATNRSGSSPPVWGTGFRNSADNSSTGVFLWMFSANQEQELHFAVQIPHDYKVGSDIYPHVHWTTVTGTPTGTNVVWGLEYTVIAMGGHFPVTSTMLSGTIDTVSGTPTGTGQHLITEFSAISGTGLGISSVLVCRLYRATGNSADTFGSEVGLLGFDVHYEQDTQGSRKRWVK